MPKGVPKTEGEKINDKFEAGYKQMRTEYKKGRSSKKAAKMCKACGAKNGGCNCCK